MHHYEHACVGQRPVLVTRWSLTRRTSACSSEHPDTRRSIASCAAAGGRNTEDRTVRGLAGTCLACRFASKTVWTQLRAL